jgi:hypothetical protein
MFGRRVRIGCDGLFDVQVTFLTEDGRRRDPPVRGAGYEPDAAPSSSRQSQEISTASPTEVGRRARIERKLRRGGRGSFLRSYHCKTTRLTQMTRHLPGSDDSRRRR